MREMPRADELPLTVAALRMQVDYHKARALMLQGQVRGRQVGGRWYVLTVDVDRLVGSRPALAAQPA